MTEGAMADNVNQCFKFNKLRQVMEYSMTMSLIMTSTVSCII